MEAIRPLQFQELVGAGILEEAGGEGASELFAQVLARQGVKPAGPGPNPVALKPEEQEGGLSGSGNEDPLPAGSQETVVPLEQLLAGVAPAGGAALETAPVMGVVGTLDVVRDAPNPCAALPGEQPVTRQEDDDRNPGALPVAGPAFLPGATSAAGTAYSTAPPDQGLNIFQPEAKSGPPVPAALDPPNPSPAIAAVALPAGNPRGYLPMTGRKEWTATPETPDPFRGAVLNSGRSTAAAAEAGAGQTPGAVPPSSPGPDGGMKNGEPESKAGDVPRPRVQPFPFETVRVESSVFETEVRTERPPDSSARPLFVIPTAPPPSGVQEFQPGTPAEGPGVPLPDKNPALETRPGLSEFKAALPMSPNPGVPVPDGERTDSPPQNPSSRAMESRPSALPGKSAFPQTPLPENFSDRADPEIGPEGQAPQVRETRPGFFEQEAQGLQRAKAAETLPAPSREIPGDFSAGVKTVLAEGAAGEKADIPRIHPGLREAVPTPSTVPGALEMERGGAASGKSPAEPERSPSGIPPLLEGPGLSAGRSPEMQSIAGDPEISGVRAGVAFTEQPEETTPLYKQLSRRLVWSLYRGEEKIQIALDPPHLGTIFVELHRNRQTLEAQVWTDNPATKGLLDGQQAQLQKALEQEGFRLDRFQVVVQPDLKSFQEERWAQGRQAGGDGPPGQPKGDPSESTPPALPAGRISRFQNGNQYIDTWI